MNLSRRRFLLGASALAICVARPASAILHGSALSGFNLGRSQAQSWDPAFSGDFPFLNLMLTATSWNYLDNQGQPLPTELDSNGYPLALGAHLGYKCIANIFPPSSRSGTYVLTWSGNGTFFLTVPDSGTVTGTGVGSLTSTTGVGRYEFTTTSPNAVVIGITAITGPSITNIQMFYKADETALNSGQFFGTQFLSTLRQGNPGVLRFLDWGNFNTSTVTTWATRKPTTYFSYVANEYRSSLYAGTTTSSGVKYSATLGSGAPADKQTIHVNFNDNPISVSIGANATVTYLNGPHGMLVGQPIIFRAPSGTALPSPISASNPGNYTMYWVTSVPTSSTLMFSATKGGANVNTTGGTLTGTPTAFATATAQNVTLSIASPAVVTWANHGLSIGDAVSINSTASFGMPAPLYNGLTYYVIASGFTTGSFQFSLTPGGAAVSTAGGSQSGQIQAFGIPTLSLNGSAGIPLLTPWGDQSADNGAPFGGNLTATLVYDADLNGWLKFGGDGGGSVGLVNTIPPEIMVSLCTAIGAHPHFCAPYLACDPMTNWHTQLATYVKNSGPSWMKPRFEGPNECWNPSLGFYSTRYAWNKSPVHWGASFSLTNHDWYGKVLSTIGQDINSIYGGTPSTQTNYAVICAIQTVTAGSGSNDPRLTSAQYVAQAASAQSGYTKSAAYNWATHSCVANYWTPGERDTPTEIIDAFNYSVTNNGNPSGQSTIATAYINTANSGCNFTGSISGLVLTVTAVSGGPLSVGCSIQNGTGFRSIITSLGTGTGGIGTYNVSSNLTGASFYTDGAMNGTPAGPFNLVGVKRFASLTHAWAVSFGSGQVSKMCGYEGGYSPDYPARDSDFNSNITGISTIANQAVVTVGTFNPGNDAGTGAAAAVGSPITINGVAGMTQINTGSGAGVTVTAGTPGQVTYPAHGFVAGQAIFFEPQDTFNSQLPNGVIFGQAYYVKTVVDANTFTVSATSGGAAINMTGSQFRGVTCIPCWVVTAVSGSNITLNVDSTSFGSYAGGGQVIYGATLYTVSMLRQAGKNVAVMQGFTTQLYNDFAAAGGEFPSCYMLSGAGVIWSVWDPNIYISTTPPQWAAIAAFNH